MGIGDIFVMLAAISLGVIFAVGGMTLHNANKIAAPTAASPPARTPASILTNVAAWVLVGFVGLAAPRIFCSTPIGSSVCSSSTGAIRGTGPGLSGKQQAAAAFVAYHQGIDAVWDRSVRGRDGAMAERLSGRAMQDLAGSASLTTAAGVSLALGLFGMLAVAGFNRSAFAKRWNGWLRVAVLAFAGAGVATPLFGLVVLNLAGSVSPDLAMPGWYMGLGLGLAATLLLIVWPIEERQSIRTR